MRGTAAADLDDGIDESFRFAQVAIALGVQHQGDVIGLKAFIGEGDPCPQRISIYQHQRVMVSGIAWYLGTYI